LKAWRIAKRKYALDRAGLGGLYDAGRWHNAGHPAIYAGLSPEVCVLEKLVHTGPIVPDDLVLVEFVLPAEDGLYEDPTLARLPANWNVIPPGDESMRFGTDFLLSRRALGLIVPSAIVPEARNILLNPVHPRFADVTLRIVRPFVFDGRLTSSN
jgi:RES domain-containing protein